MLTKRVIVKRTKEEKELILLDIERLGVVAGCRKHGIYATTYYEWLEKYKASGIEGLVDQRGRTNEKELREAQKQLRMLKELLAEKELELKMKDELLKKKMAQWKNAKK